MKTLTVNQTTIESGIDLMTLTQSINENFREINKQGAILQLLNGYRYDNALVIPSLQHILDTALDSDDAYSWPIETISFYRELITDIQALYDLAGFPER